MKNKRGLSSVVTTLMIILLVLVAVGIVWVVVKNIIVEGSDEISISSLTLDLKIEKAFVDGGDIVVIVKRNAGKGDLSGVSFILLDGANNEVVKEKFEDFDELESRRFAIVPVDFEVEEILEVAIAPIYRLESGKEKQGGEVDRRVLKKISEEEIPDDPECVPDCGENVCGDYDGCGGSCGLCEVDQSCEFGQCILDVIAKGNILYLRFEDNLSGAGEILIDDSGEGHDGTISGNVDCTVDGLVGDHGCSFGGTNAGHINLGDIDAIGSNREFTLSLWAKRNGIGSDEQFIFGDEQQGNKGIMMQLESSFYRVESFLSGYRVFNYNLNLDKVNHLVYIQNSSGLSLYVNGQFYEIITEVQHIDTNADFFIGQFYSGSRSFKGIIDEIMMFDEALTSDEILYLYELNY